MTMDTGVFRIKVVKLKVFFFRETNVTYTQISLQESIVKNKNLEKIFSEHWCNKTNQIRQTFIQDYISN